MSKKGEIRLVVVDHNGVEVSGHTLLQLGNVDAAKDMARGLAEAFSRMLNKAAKDKRRIGPEV